MGEIDTKEIAIDLFEDLKCDVKSILMEKTDRNKTLGIK